VSTKVPLVEPRVKDIARDCESERKSKLDAWADGVALGFREGSLEIQASLVWNIAVTGAPAFTPTENAARAGRAPVEESAQRAAHSDAAQTAVR